MTENACSLAVLIWLGLRVESRRVAIVMKYQRIGHQPNIRLNVGSLRPTIFVLLENKIQIGLATLIFVTIANCSNPWISNGRKF